MNGIGGPDVHSPDRGDPRAMGSARHSAGVVQIPLDQGATDASGVTA
jgi:hypothetical protein